METDYQLCPDCRFIYHSDNRVPCLCCETTSLTIPCSPNLVGIVERLLDRSIEVVSSSCDIHDVYDDNRRHIGQSCQITVELGSLYPIEMFDNLPPEWTTYIYHTVDNGQIGPAYTGLSHVDSYLDDEEECEFATMVTISNLETYLDDKPAESFWSVWKLAGDYYRHQIKTNGG